MPVNNNNINNIQINQQIYPQQLQQHHQVVYNSVHPHSSPMILFEQNTI